MEALADLDETLGEAYLTALEGPSSTPTSSSAAASSAVSKWGALGLDPLQATIGLDTALPGLTPPDLR